ncbi:MAG: sn-glycerol-3-phosphate ABC transporter ATP-binding protein UgpC [Pseudomonadota bacterium]
MARVTLSAVEKYYGANRALADVSLAVDDGAFAVFVGPSGCGKSTLLRAVAGLEMISSGQIHIGETEVSDLPPSDRDVAMVFQSYALYPHMTVRQNIDFGMRVRGVAQAERERRITDAARILQLDDYLDRRPAELSGGQRQRVAIGRAIVKEPQVFLFDEPLSNLDAKLRIQMRVELEALHRQLGATMIYVTHDQVEAMTMADTIVVLNEGRVEQVGPPLELYRRPRTEFVAGFIGAPSMNFLDIAAENGVLHREGHRLADAPAVGAPIRLGIRPEHLALGTAGEGMLEAEVAVSESLGGETYLHVDASTGDRIVVKTDGETTVKAGDRISLSLPPQHVHLFDAAGQALRDPGDQP